MNHTIESSQATTSPHVLVVAGLRNQESLSWAALQPWLEADPNNEALVTVRNHKAVEFIEEQNQTYNNRIRPISIDWKEQADDAADIIHDTLQETYGAERVVAGALHAIARANPKTFNDRASKIPVEDYQDAMTISAFSLASLTKGVSGHLREHAGVATFGYGNPRQTELEYGPTMAVAKAALDAMTVQLAPEGQEFPHPRFAAIYTGFIPTNSGRGVARLQGTTAESIAEHTAKQGMLPAATPERQRRSAGELALQFMVEPTHNPKSPFAAMTGVQFYVDGGRTLQGPGLVAYS